MGTYDGEVGHPDELRVAFLDERHPPELVDVPGEDLLDRLEEVVVDVKDELEVSRKEVSEEGHAPLLERLGEDCKQKG